MAGVGEAFQEIRARGIKIMVHSCNNPDYIGQRLLNQGIVIDGIWAGAGKPVASVYVDDRGYRFTGDWQQTAQDVIAMVESRPVRSWS